MRKEHANLVSLLADHATFYLLDLPPNSKKPILLRTHLKISATVPYGTIVPDIQILFLGGKNTRTHIKLKKHVLQESRLPNWCPSSMGGSTRQSRVHDRFSGALATTLLRTNPWAAVRFCWSYSFDVLGNPFFHRLSHNFGTPEFAGWEKHVPCNPDIFPFRGECVSRIPQVAINAYIEIHWNTLNIWFMDVYICLWF